MSAASPQAERCRVLDLMRHLRAMRDDEYLLWLLAYHAAPTLAGIKPASLICPGRLRCDPESALAKCAPRLARAFGVEVAGFRNRIGAPLFLVYDSRLLRSALAVDEATALLSESGYDLPTAEVGDVVGRLGRRCAGSCFPHEIGVFLGYPPRDVRLFMGEGRAACPSGLGWRAYGDFAEAGRLAGRFRSAKRLAAELIMAGAGLGELAAALRGGNVAKGGAAA